jgi:hypothetical protein
MINNAFCPVSFKKVNTAVVRTHAVINVLVLLAFLYTQNFYIALFLFSDFLVRVINFPRLSLVGLLAKQTVNVLRLKGHQEDAGPKLFAARIGLLFSLVIVLSLLVSATPFAIATAGVLAFFSFLEGAFGICVACIIYPWVYKLFYRNRNELSGITSQK